METYNRPSTEKRLTPNEKKDVKRAIAAVVMGVIAIAGIKKIHDDKVVHPEAVAVESDKLSNVEQKSGENFENEYLPVGSVQTIAEGIYIIDPSKLNVRTSPVVIEDNADGQSNRYTLSGKMYVANPVRVGADINGTWWLATDSSGRNFFFTGNNGGITNYETGKQIDALSSSFDKEPEIVATTSSGNVASTKSGENILVATIVEIEK